MERKKSRSSQVITWGFGAMILFAIIGAVFLATTSGNKNSIAQLGVSYPIQAAQHITEGATHPPYNSNPPTSGPHYAQPAKWGVYETELPDEQLVHNLEHGGIWISYKNIDDATKKELEDIGRSNVKVILTPRAKDDSPIALASWGRLMALDTFDKGAIMDFIKANRYKAPEPSAP